MTIRTYVALSLAMAGCAAVAYTVGRHARDLERRLLKDELRTWEDEGGKVARTETRIADGSPETAGISPQ